MMIRKEKGGGREPAKGGDAQVALVTNGTRTVGLL